MRTLTRTLGLSAAVFAAAACSNDAPAPTESSSINASVANFSAEAVGQDIEFMHGPGGFWGFGLRVGRDFECSSFTGDFVTVERTCTFYDADGVAQPAYDSLTTASASLHVSASGAINRGDWGSSSFSRTRDLTVTGLLGSETSRTWNGSSSGTMTGIRTSEGGDSVQMDLTSSGLITDLVLPFPKTETGWPLSGTIAFTMTVTFTGGPHDGETFTRDVRVAFDGTQYATVTVNGETFTIDLARRRCTGDGDHRGEREHT